MDLFTGKSPARRCPLSTVHYLLCSCMGTNRIIFSRINSDMSSKLFVIHVFEEQESEGFFTKELFRTTKVSPQDL